MHTSPPNRQPSESSAQRQELYPSERPRSVTYLLRAIGLGVVVGLIGSVFYLPPVDRALEMAGRPIERHGLNLLFKLRGDTKAPEVVSIVGIDERSAVALGLPPNPQEWPRYWHACLVDSLAEQGARIIVFDVFFGERRTPDASISNQFFAKPACHQSARDLKTGLDHDRILANAIRRWSRLPAGSLNKTVSTVLYEHTDQTALSVDGVKVQKVTRLAPVKSIAEAARGIGPFVVPKGVVDRFWPIRSIGDKISPSLPLIALQLHSMDEFLKLMLKLSPEDRDPSAYVRHPTNPDDLDRLMLDLHQTLKSDAHAFESAISMLYSDSNKRLAPEQEARQKAIAGLLKAYRGVPDTYIYFYGGANTVETVSYVDAIDQKKPQSIRGRVVFVGTSDSTKIDREDIFDTVVSTPDKIYLSGVEIAATAFANMLTDRALARLQPHSNFLIVFFFGVLVGLLAYVLPSWPALGVTAVVWGIYCYVALMQFEQQSLWMPLAVPALQVPAALIIALAWHYYLTKRERSEISEIFRHYVPVTPAVGLMNQSRFGTILFADIEGFTALGESRSPQELVDLLNQYFSAVTRPIEKYGGAITQYQGDAILAVFNVIDEDAEHARDAVQAAVEIQRVVNETEFLGGVKLKTRIGINSGELVAATVGSEDRVTYTVHGGAVNLAARLEFLNKQFGTRILVSQATADLAGDHFDFRRIGQVSIRGRKNSLTVYEVA